jgi:hypothetical protein
MGDNTIESQHNEYAEEGPNCSGVEKNDTEFVDLPNGSQDDFTEPLYYN